MARFSYTAHAEGGAVIRDVIEAVDRDEAQRLLAQRDLIVVRIEVEQTASAKSTGASASVQDLAAFAYELSVVLDAGIALPTALGSYATSGDTPFMRELRDITEEVRAGSPLSACLERRPNTFPAIFPALVRSGEESGGLATSLSQLSRHFERIDGLRNTVTQTAAYPFVVACMAFLIVFALVVFVVPRFAAIYEQLNVAIPAPTRFFLMLGRYSTAISALTAMLLVVGVPLLISFGRTERGQRLRDAVTLRLGPIGSVVRDLAMATFCQTLGLLYDRGIKIHDAVSLAAAACGNIVLAERLGRLSEGVRAGTPLSTLMQSEHLLEDRYLGMVRAGESTGQIGVMLAKVAEITSTRAESRIKKLLSLLEPALITMIAVVVGGIVIALAAPILNLQASIT
ncbi:MAG: type II secretion system F family protein [Proteobacteria bacterium]|nr:type II secretion system F family protein [Pseudomonadota bacterium]